MRFKQSIIKNLSSIPGWRSNRKIVVIESDDWGSIRMPSLDLFNEFCAKGFDMVQYDAMRYNMNDTMENAADLDALYQALCSVKDQHGHAAVLTAVSVVANPDFEKIKQSGYSQYYYEPFTETLNKYRCDGAYEMIQEGVRKHIFVPQYHGREHLNVAVWMRALQEKDADAITGFQHGIWGFNNKHPYNVMYQAAYDVSDPAEIQGQEEILADGLDLFEKLHGYRASFFVAPNGKMNNRLEPATARHGIKYMSASPVLHESLGYGKTRRYFHYLGQQNTAGQLYILRNLIFEPSLDNRDWVGTSLQQINIAFKWGKPAIIGSHRVNYMGGLNKQNRTNGTLQLSRLLKEITKKWPDVEFLSTDQLGAIMANNK